MTPPYSLAQLPRLPQWAVHDTLPVVGGSEITPAAQPGGMLGGTQNRRCSKRKLGALGFATTFRRKDWICNSSPVSLRLRCCGKIWHRTTSQGVAEGTLHWARHRWPRIATASAKCGLALLHWRAPGTVCNGTSWTLGLEGSGADGHTCYLPCRGGNRGASSPAFCNVRFGAAGPWEFAKHRRCSQITARRSGRGST